VVFQHGLQLVVNFLLVFYLKLAGKFESFTKRFQLHRNLLGDDALLQNTGSAVLPRTWKSIASCKNCFLVSHSKTRSESSFVFRNREETRGLILQQ
jgi:hypothetical protein